MGHPGADVSCPALEILPVCRRRLTSTPTEVASLSSSRARYKRAPGPDGFAVQHACLWASGAATTLANATIVAVERWFSSRARTQFPAGGWLQTVLSAWDQGSLARCPSPSPLPRCTAATVAHPRSLATRSGYTFAFTQLAGCGGAPGSTRRGGDVRDDRPVGAHVRPGLRAGVRRRGRRMRARQQCGSWTPALPSLFSNS